MATGTYTSECGRWHIDNCRRGRRNWGLWYREDPTTPITRARKVVDCLTLTHAKEWAAEMASYGVTDCTALREKRARIRELEKEANADTTPCGYCGSEQGYTYHDGHSERECIECHGC
jgi:hypothetical protein